MTTTNQFKNPYCEKQIQSRANKDLLKDKGWIRSLKDVCIPC